MVKLTIIGSSKPVIGEKEMYSVSSLNGWDHLVHPLKNPLEVPKTHWEVMVKTQKGWRKGGSNKEGQTVPYTFGQKSLLHREIKIVAQQGEDKAELMVHPQRAKESKITKVDLLDANYQPIPKGKKLSYKDTIIARAYCVEMFMMHVAFSLWEDDAQGEGHNPVINALNKINSVPVLGTVDEKGIAEAVFRLPAYTMAVQIANARIASGDQDEGATHEYYVTADVISRKIQKTSANVNVDNPTYTEAPPRQRKLPAGQTLPPPKPVPVTPKPKEETAKFPQTPAAKKQGDPEGKILSAEFTDGTGKAVKNAKTVDVVSIKIISQNMKGKNVKVRIWEEDFSKWSHDLLYEKTVQLIGATSFVNYITLTKEMYNKGYSFGEKELEYFIEVEHNNTSVTSAVIPVTLDAPQTIVPKGKSVYVVGEREVEKREEKVCECEAKVRAFMRMLRVGEATGELIKSSKYNKEKKNNETIYIIHDFQKGYTTAFGGNKITDLSTHPQKNYGGSTAAGAYQIMRYTWWWLNGEKLNEDRTRAQIYEDNHDYIKKYGIPNYSPESQDKVCVIIMKHKQKGLLDLIINNNIEKAIRNQGSAEWASLPHEGDMSRYKFKGKKQSATPFKICIKHYDKFLKEELIGISPLHLKKGFLDEFGYDCCKNNNVQANNDKQLACEGKGDIDLRSKMTFIAQKTKTDCNLTCRRIMSSLGVVPENPNPKNGNQSYYQTAIESNDHKKLILNQSDFKEGMDYIDKSLEAGYPIMVGVNHTLNYGYNEDVNTSDHYVIIVGRICDNNVLKYRFWDVATRRGAEGDFRFTLYITKLYADKVWKTDRKYTLTQVRRNLDNQGKLIKF